MGLKQMEDEAFSAFWSTSPSGKPTIKAPMGNRSPNQAPMVRVATPPRYYRAARQRIVYVQPRKSNFVPIAKQAAKFIKARSPILSYESRAKYEKERYAGRVRELEARRELNEFTARNKELSKQQRAEVVERVRGFGSKIREAVPKKSVYGSKSIRSLKQLFGGRE